MAQKGPLILGSSITAQELRSDLSPSGQQYSYQTNSDLGTFEPTNSFGSPYVGLAATGYYFDESAGAVSSAPITLYGISDLSAEPLLNVNLLTTLAYQRIQKLVKTSGLSIGAATQQAERETLAALGIPNPALVSGFGTLDIGKAREGDKALAAVSSLFVQGHTPGDMSALIANFQADLAANGRITSTATQATLAASARAVDAASVAANLQKKYAASGSAFVASDIAAWLDQDGSGLVGRFKYQVANASPSSVFAVPKDVTSPFVGEALSVDGGQLLIDGTVVESPQTLKAGDVVAVAPSAGTFPGGAREVYLMQGKTRIAKATFVAGLASIKLSTTTPSVPLGATAQFVATGSFTDGSTSDVTGMASWSSSATNVATVGAVTGRVSTLARGTTTIMASLGEAHADASLVVTDAVLRTISLSPTPAATGIDVARPLVAQGLYSDGTEMDVTRNASWSSSSPAIASVAGGVVTGSELGSTRITAKVGDVEATVDLAVTRDTWSPVRSMITPRRGNSATLLPNGTVLVVGGLNANGFSIASTEIYDPAKNLWTQAAPLPEARGWHQAIALSSGQVLVIGGQDHNLSSTPAATYLYDPTSNRWTSAGRLNVPRYGFATVRLSNGQVMVVAGWNENNKYTATAELFDPQTLRWATVASMSYARAFPSATLLANGQILVAGGMGMMHGGDLTASAEIYDSVSNTWTQAAQMIAPRYAHTATLLADGRVLVAGGLDDQMTAASEIYDPASNAWTATTPMIAARQNHKAVALPDGRVIVMGGDYSDSSFYLATTEIYDPVAATWTSAARMVVAEGDAPVVLLPGTTPVLLTVGGDDERGLPTANAQIHW